MICQTCGPGVKYGASEIGICWCKAELCSAHLTEHLPKCSLYKNPSLSEKPSKVARAESRVFKQKGFEGIGGIVRPMMRRKRR